MKSDMEEAVYQDLGRTHFVTEICEVTVTIEMINHTLDHIEDYTRDVPTDPALIFAPCSSKLRYEPLGVAMIMGSWNYPYFVTLKPLVTCIAAGNCALIKPSELGPCAAKVIEVLV